MKMATLLQDDLAHLGMQVHVVPLEFRAVIDRVFQSFDYDAAIMGLGGGDADPNPEMNVWMSNGPRTSGISAKSSPPPLGARDRPVNGTTDGHARLCQTQATYDRVQQLIAENLPFIF